MLDSGRCHRKSFAGVGEEPMEEYVRNAVGRCVKHARYGADFDHTSRSDRLVPVMAAHGSTTPLSSCRNANRRNQPCANGHYPLLSSFGFTAHSLSLALPVGVQLEERLEWLLQDGRDFQSNLDRWQLPTCDYSLQVDTANPHFLRELRAGLAPRNRVSDPVLNHITHKYLSF